MKLPERDPLNGTTPSRHPFQLLALAACALSGASTAFDWGQPATLTSLIADPFVIAWGWILMIGGLIGLISSFWPDRIFGLLLERLALAAIGSITLIYGIELLLVVGSPAAVAGITEISVSVASAWRIWHITRELKVLSRWIDGNFD